MQGLAFDDRDRLWASEFGQNTFDELNLIEAGDNYGWPMVEGRGGQRRTSSTRRWSGTTEVASPSGLAFLDGQLWLASLRGRAAVADRRRPGSGPGTRRTSSSATTAGCAPSAVAPDGRLWVTTCNRDGRGEPAASDDRILVIECTGPLERPRVRVPARRAAVEAATTPVTVARRAARRSVVSTAGPSTTIATEFVIARPVSKLPVDVSSV